MKAIVLVVLAALAGCPARTPTPDVLTGPVPETYQSQQTTCEKSGGIWGQSTGTGFYSCMTRMRDSGKHCEAGNECQGQCLARSQTCAPVDPLFGCQDVLDDSGRAVTLCRN